MGLLGELLFRGPIAVGSMGPRAMVGRGGAGVFLLARMAYGAMGHVFFTRLGDELDCVFPALIPDLKGEAGVPHIGV